MHLAAIPRRLFAGQKDGLSKRNIAHFLHNAALPARTSTVRFGALRLALAIGTLAALLTAWAPQVFNDGDTFMHVAAGLRMLEAHAVLTTDPFSFTFRNRPWQTHEWLSEVLMATSYRLGGWSGVALLMAAAFGATAGLLTRHLTRWLSGPALVATVVVGLATLSSSLLARRICWPCPCWKCGALNW